VSTTCQPGDLARRTLSDAWSLWSSVLVRSCASCLVGANAVPCILMIAHKEQSSFWFETLKVFRAAWELEAVHAVWCVCVYV